MLEVVATQDLPHGTTPPFPPLKSQSQNFSDSKCWLFRQTWRNFVVAAISFPSFSLFHMGSWGKPGKTLAAQTLLQIFQMGTSNKRDQTIFSLFYYMLKLQEVRLPLRLPRRVSNLWMKKLLSAVYKGCFWRDCAAGALPWSPLFPFSPALWNTPPSVVRGRVTLKACLPSSHGGMWCEIRAGWAVTGAKGGSPQMCLRCSLRPLKILGEKRGASHHSLVKSAGLDLVTQRQLVATRWSGVTSGEVQVQMWSQKNWTEIKPDPDLKKKRKVSLLTSISVR